MIDRRQQSGFTLMEVVVAASIFSLVMLLSVSLYANVTRNQRRVQSLTKVQDDARFVLETLAQSVRLDAVDYRAYLDPNGDGVYADYRNLGLAEEYLVTTSGAERRYFRRLTAGSRGYLAVCLATTNPNFCNTPGSPAGNFRDITPANINITAFRVFIAPSSDPYAPSPQAVTDCYSQSAPNTYDPVRGVCACDSAGTGPPRCFPGQTCDATNRLCVRANAQPRVTIAITSSGGSARLQESVEPRTYQTTVSSRIFRR